MIMKGFLSSNTETLFTRKSRQKTTINKFKEEKALTRHFTESDKHQQKNI